MGHSLFVGLLECVYADEILTFRSFGLISICQGAY